MLAISENAGILPPEVDNLFLIKIIWNFYDRTVMDKNILTCPYLFAGNAPEHFKLFQLKYKSLGSPEYVFTVKMLFA